MKALRKYGVDLLIWIIVAGMAILRLTSYGELNLSIANADTQSYIDEAAPPLFSRDMLTRSRLFTTNLLYNVAKVQECPLLAISHPALGSELERAVQPCFTRIVIFQNLFAVIAWSALALVIAKKLTGGFEKALAVLLIAGFGFTPAIADWDSVLGSESLTFSLFALCLAIVLAGSFKTAAAGEDDRSNYFIGVLAIVVLFLWAFTRDANIYALAVLFGMILFSFILFPVIRKDEILWVVGVAALIITIVGTQSAMESRRWKKPLTNTFEEFIMPYPARVDFMQGLGMPERLSADYPGWFLENAPRAYARFLIAHPGYAFTSFSSNLGGLFSENIQPYFFSEETTQRTILIAMNDVLHPNTYIFLILDILLIAGLLISAFRRKSREFTAWMWVSLWLFASASAMLVINFFADSIGVTRHTMFAVEMFRLMSWLFLILLFERANRKEEAL